ncbi:RNA polymerase sigma factor, partial [Streptomyces montanus]|uniref:RNA polymerase sigma factor n=1 Tax=Streptomyces montanus TaxID=2580423 RepID=UPI0024830846
METNRGELRARIRAGDAEAFGALFDAYARSVYNHAFRLTADWSAAEDIVSLTFLEAWRLRERLDAEGGSPRPWLLGIATNVARNTRRAARRHAAAVAR